MRTPSTPQKLVRITTVPMALRYLLPGQMDFMQQQGYDVLMISADGKELPEVLAQEKCRHIVVPMTRKITPLQDLKCLWQLVKIFRKEKPDIVHSHTPKAGLLGMLAAFIARTPTRIHTVAGLPLMVETGFKHRLLKAIEKLTYSAATQVWPNSPSLYQYIMKEQLTRPSKLKLIGSGSTNGINTERFDPAKMQPHIMQQVKESINYQPELSYFLCMGRLVKDKGIVELINAFTALSLNQNNSRLILVGDFEDGLDPLPRHTKISIKNNPAILHVKWTNEVEYYMQLAHSFVFPSHREGFPNVLLQAGAMKLPIICSNIVGNKDIVKNNETGFVFDVANEKQMQDLMLRSLQERGTMMEMAAQLRQKVNAEFQRSFIWKNIHDQYVFLSAQPQPVYSITLQVRKAWQLVAHILTPQWDMWQAPLPMEQLEKRSL